VNFSKLVAVLLLGLSFFSNVASAECFKDFDHIFDQGRDYFQRSQFLLSTQQFSTYALLSCDSEKQNRGRLRWAQSLFELGETGEANLVLDKVPVQSPHFATSKTLRTWYQPSLISSLPEADQKRFHEWDRRLNSLPEPKNPWLSGGLSSVVPGLGQVYNGNYQSALFSFALNALFLSATLELQDKKMHATALASGVMFSVVYVGNIVGSVQSSRALNRNSQKDQKSEWKVNLFPELTF
jgi:hypothetical protein